MKSHRHTMIQVRPRNGPTLNLLRIENRKMARVSILIKNIRQQIPFTFS